MRFCDLLLLNILEIDIAHHFLGSSHILFLRSSIEVMEIIPQNQRQPDTT